MDVTAIKESYMGANVVFCGHRGYFIADIHVVGNVAVVALSAPVSPGELCRDNEFGKPTHLMVDFPTGGYWKPSKGIFVVPVRQVRKL